MTCLDSQDTTYYGAHGLDGLQWEDTKKNQYKEKAYEGKCRGNRTQASKSPPLSGVTQDVPDSSGRSCDHTEEKLSARETR